MNEFRPRLVARVEGVDALRWSAAAVTLGFVGLVSLVVGGYAVTDPGGWAGIGGTVIGVLVMLGLSLLALARPRGAIVALAVAACGPLAFGVWSLVDYGAAHGWEDRHGPLSLVLVMFVCAPAAAAGPFRPRAAGYLILTVSVVPLLLEAAGAASRFYEPLSVGLLLAPLVASGVLFLLSGRRQGHPTQGHPITGHPTTGPHPTPSDPTPSASSSA
ncbi:hypothetical protein [Phycicoccus sp. Soil748]|uniref:hypothetical protein n=1 Tax=Phycicoccus sp. Soil748 TaxID=1736397 RepID=UPI000B0B3540|nr:hypothetical protein [Phycicoccus sp. Soil748]